MKRTRKGHGRDSLPCPFRIISGVEAICIDVIALGVDVDVAQEFCRANVIYSFVVDCHELLEGVVHDTAGFVVEKFLGAACRCICREPITAVIEAK